MIRHFRVTLLLVVLASFGLGVASTVILSMQGVQAQQQAAPARASELPSVFQPNAKVFLQTPEQIAQNVFTVRDVSASWVLVEHADGGNRGYQQYWVYAPLFAWGVGGAFKPAAAQ